MDDLISRQAAIDALWKALYEYEDKTEKQFLESDELDVGDWFLHRIFVQNMSDIDRQVIIGLPSEQERKKGKWMRPAGIGTISSSYRFICSECGETAYQVTGDCGRRIKTAQKCTYKWCPNCGAGMEGVENDT